MRYSKPSCKKIPATYSPNPIIFSVYNKLVASAKYFNHLQIRNINLAVFFFLTAFFAIGAILGRVTTIPFDRFLVVSSICLTSMIAIIFFLIMDTFFYNRYLEATVIELAVLEKNHPWLPQTHRRMIFILGKTRAFQKSMIYISFIFILLLFLILNLSFIYHA